MEESLINLFPSFILLVMISKYVKKSLHVRLFLLEFRIYWIVDMSVSVLWVNITNHRKELSSFIASC